MRFAISAVSFTLFVALFAGPALAEEILLADGEDLEAQVLEVREDAIKVKFTPKDGGSVTMDLPSRRLEPDYFYGLRDKAVGQDAKARLRLAMWALEQGLFSRAKAQVRKAAAIDPKLVKDIEEGKLPEIREGIADRILASAQADARAGRFDNAEEKLQILLARLPDTEAGGKARDELATVEAREEEEEAKQEAKEKAEKEAKLAEEEKKASAEREKTLDGVKKGLKQGKKWMGEGLREDNDTKALELLERALVRGKQGLDDLAEIEKTKASDAKLVAEAGALRKKVVAAMVRIHFRRADLYAYRNSMVQARDEVKKAQALDPENPELLAALQRIEYAEADGDIWWVRGRRPGIDGTPRFGGGARGGGRGGGGGGRR